MEDEILNKNFVDDSETENYSLNESSDVSTDEECDSILTSVQTSSSNCFIGKNGYKWNKNHAIIGRTRSHNIITHLPGLKGPAKPKPNCGIDIFNLFFTAAIIKQISEFTNAKIEEFRQRISDLTKRKPDIIMDYNLTKGGVDTIDQMVSNFSTSRRSRRWPLALFYALLDITALNSYIIFNYQIDKKDQKERSTFIVDLGRSLIDEHLATRNLNSLPLELQTTIKKFKNNDGSSTSRGSTMRQESDTPKGMSPPTHKSKELKKKRNEEKRLKEYSEGQKILLQKELVEKQRKESKKKQRKVTLSIAVPGSILENSASLILRTILAGQVARSAAIYQVEEIVVYDEANSLTIDGEDISPQTERGHANILLAKLLQYLECPQYLRKILFPLEEDLNHVGLLHPMNMPHHLGVGDWYPYREGLVVGHTPDQQSIIHVGLKKSITVKENIEKNFRVTVRLSKGSVDHTKVKATVVSSQDPRKELGVYWGYKIRMALGLHGVLNGCPYADSYDLIIGTSDKGTPVAEAKFKKAKHALIVFGGVDGIEASIESDPNLKGQLPTDLFHHYINTRPNQGTRTIRTEEAIPISLEAIVSKLEAK
ncbi:C9orf114 [Cordylochernes scorpioides]|uniref:C9orf114 n=1 Tax=Cordylochernes scorpioides TaxID=51811 RepID=A0ABY6LPY2_9ARAC|nr:C9orf114 [Cordylochernes scorpioides]